MANDSNKRKVDIYNRGCNVYDAKSPQSRPLAHWNKNDVAEYTKNNNIKICDIYNMGYARTGCAFCMFGLEQERKDTGMNRFQKMEVTHPKLYDYCLNKLGAKEILDFMNIPYHHVELKKQLKFVL